MSIQAAVRTIERMEKAVDALNQKYREDRFIHGELIQLLKQLKLFKGYLNNIDQLKPDYDTNSLQEHMQALTLHVDLLDKQLTQHEARDLKRRIALLKTILKFHPTRYSPVAFVFAWLYEWLYFI